MKRVIEGINPIPGFNGSQNIDLNVYAEIDIPTQIDGTFSHIGSIKLDDVDFDTTNDAIYVHKIKELTTDETKTEWEQYGKDAII